MDCITTYDVKYLGIFLAGRPKGLLTRQYIVEEVFNLPTGQPSTPGCSLTQTTLIWVPPRPAQAFGSALWPGLAGANFPPEYWARQAQLESAVFVVISR